MNSRGKYCAVSYAQNSMNKILSGPKLGPLSSSQWSNLSVLPHTVTDLERAAFNVSKRDGLIVAHLFGLKCSFDLSRNPFLVLLQGYGKEIQKRCCQGINSVQLGGACAFSSKHLRFPLHLTREQTGLERDTVLTSLSSATSSTP